MHMYAYDPSCTYWTYRTCAPVRSGEYSWVYSVHMVHVSDFPRWRFGPRGQGLRRTNLTTDVTEVTIQTEELCLSDEDNMSVI